MMHQMQVMVSLTFALALYCAAPASNNSDTHGGEDAQLGSQKASIEKNTGSFRHLLAASSQTSWPEEYDVLQSAARARGRILLESNRVAGVGAGIFVFFLFLAFCVVLCLVGTRTKIPWVVFTVSLTILVIVILALFASPRGDPPEPPASGYDKTIGGLTTVMVLLCVGIFFAGIGFVGIVASEQHFARPLSYHLDVDVQ